ncbi:dihydroxy-acid dehydratase domain-containing protein [Actinomadura madurae]|uniref:dihydroxy-acid dehydratase domain-containing protein n=1 Tax=Actinomadura madurae TaxID=1993 RepID=UPI003556D7FE
MAVHPVLAAVTRRVVERSAGPRGAYLERIRDARTEGPVRSGMGCANLAHGFAACGVQDKLWLRGDATPNIAIVSSYNDMLSAHQPLKDYPDLLKAAIRAAGGTAQFAGGVPAMCDGITQGRARAWSCRCSAGTWWRWRRPWRCPTTCSTAPCSSACATRSSRGW